MLGWQAAVYVLAWRFLIQPACGMDFSTYNASMLPALVSTVLATLLAYVVVSVLPVSLQLLVGSLVLAGAYLFLSWFYNRLWVETVAELLCIALPLYKK